MKLGWSLGMLLAVVLHVGVLCFGGLLFMGKKDDHATIQQVELLKSDDAAADKQKEKEKKKEAPAEKREELERLRSARAACRCA